MLQADVVNSRSSPMGEIFREAPALFEIVVDRQELARRLMLSPSFISKLMAEEGLPYMKIGRSARFDVEAVKLWLKQRIKP